MFMKGTSGQFGNACLKAYRKDGDQLDPVNSYILYLSYISYIIYVQKIFSENLFWPNNKSGADELVYEGCTGPYGHIPTGPTDQYLATMMGYGRDVPPVKRLEECCWTWHVICYKML